MDVTNPALAGGKKEIVRERERESEKERKRDRGRGGEKWEVKDTPSPTMTLRG